MNDDGHDDDSDECQTYMCQVHRYLKQRFDQNKC